MTSIDQLSQVKASADAAEIREKYCDNGYVVVRNLLDRAKDLQPTLDEYATVLDREARAWHARAPGQRACGNNNLVPTPRPELWQDAPHGPLHHSYATHAWPVAPPIGGGRGAKPALDLSVYAITDARLHAMAIDAANRVGVPAPATVWELPNDAPNAFAVGGALPPASQTGEGECSPNSRHKCAGSLQCLPSI